MKYLDENIVLTVTGMTIANAGTYVYKIKDRLDNIIFVGNTFLNAGDTSKEFDITDIVANYKWKADLRKPLPQEISGTTTTIDKYRLELTVPVQNNVGLLSANPLPNIFNVTYSSDTVNVAMVYRYPNRKYALEPSLFDIGVATGVRMINCLQGARDGVCEFYPHIPYKSTTEYGFGVLYEVYSGNTGATLTTNFGFEGQLYRDSGGTISFLPPISVNFKRFNTIYSGAKESHVVHPTYTTSGFTQETEVEGQDIFYTWIGDDSEPHYLIISSSDGDIGYYPFTGETKIDIDLTNAPTPTLYFKTDITGNQYVAATSDDYIGKTHLKARAWVRGDGMVLYIEIYTQKGELELDNTYLTVTRPRQSYGQTVYASGINTSKTSDEIVEFMIDTLHYSRERAEAVEERLEDGHRTMVYSGTYAEVWDMMPTLQQYYTSITVETLLKDKTNRVAIIDKGCLPKYYLLWQDRYGGYQSQPFGKVETFSMEYDFEEMSNYQNFRRNVMIQAQPIWRVQTDWINEKYYPYYESIFVSPYLLLYDTEENKSYNVIPTTNNFVEKTWRNQHAFFNMELELELAKPQNIIY